MGVIIILVTALELRMCCTRHIYSVMLIDLCEQNVYHNQSKATDTSGNILEEATNSTGEIV